MAGSYTMAAHDTTLLENLGDASEAIEEMLWLIFSQIGHENAMQLLDAKYYPMARGEIPMDEAYLKSEAVFAVEQYYEDDETSIVCVHGTCSACEADYEIVKPMNLYDLLPKTMNGDKPLKFMQLENDDSIKGLWDEVGELGAIVTIVPDVCVCEHEELEHRLDKTCGKCICIRFRSE